MRYLCLLALVHGGCLTTAQLAIGPTIDERGGLGGVVRLRGSLGTDWFSFVGSAEALVAQPKPHTVLGTGIGVGVRWCDEKLSVPATVRAVLAGTVSGQGRFVGMFGGSIGLLGVLQKNDCWRVQSGQGLAIGGELAADYVFGGWSRGLLLSPSFVFQYRGWTDPR